MTGCLFPLPETKPGSDNGSPEQQEKNPAPPPFAPALLQARPRIFQVKPRNFAAYARAEEFFKPIVAAHIVGGFW